MKRRDFLTASALAGAGSALGLQVAPVAAQGVGAVAGIAAARRFKIGAAEVTAFSDGFLSIGPEALIGVSPEDFTALLKAAYIDGAAHPTGVNAYLIDAGGTRTLVDAGTGTVFGPTLGQLAANMAALDVDPASVDRVFVTHLHPDHIGGLVTESGNPFPNASLVAAQADIDFWTSAEIKSQAPKDFQGFFDLATAAHGSFGDKVEGVSGEADLGNGMTAMPLPGHTVGHTGLMLESEGASLLIWGDIVHVPPVQFARPDVTIGFDTDQDTARATRIRLLDQVATDSIQVAGMHIGFPGVGYLERAGEGYRFVPAPWQYG